MRYTQLVLAAGMVLAGPAAAAADTIEARLARLEARVAELQKQLDDQSRTIEQQAATIADQDAMLQGAPPRLQKLGEAVSAAETEETPWYRRVEAAGLIEFEASYLSPYDGPGESDLSLATFELGVVAPVGDWIEAGATLLYEQGGTPLEVDVAYVTLANRERTPMFLTAGQVYVPFGSYETRMVSDPLTLEIGETRETAVEAGFDTGGIGAGVYVFNGSNDNDGASRVSSWGVGLGIAREGDGTGWSAGIDYLSDLGDSDALQDVIADSLGNNDTERTPAWSAAFAAARGPWSVIGEYLSATEAFEAAAVPWQGRGARPSAWNVELGYAFELFHRPASIALGYQGTREALALELPERRVLATVSTEIHGGASLSVEWAHDKDYSLADGGTGSSADTVTVQLAAEF